MLNEWASSRREVCCSPTVWAERLSHAAPFSLAPQSVSRMWSWGLKSKLNGSTVCLNVLHCFNCFSRALLGGNELCSSEKCSHVLCFDDGGGGHSCQTCDPEVFNWVKFRWLSRQKIKVAEEFYLIASDVISKNNAMLVMKLYWSYHSLSSLSTDINLMEIHVKWKYPKIIQYYTLLLYTAYNNQWIPIPCTWACFITTTCVCLPLT